MKAEISPEVRIGAPGLKVILVEADISNPPTSDQLWEEITREEERIHTCVEMSQANKSSAIQATRKAYKQLGKDPNRYRPSAEALTRRCVKGEGLYRTLTVIDLINLLSLKFGHSIGGFDLDKIDGEKIILGVGKEGEPYEAIGRGPLNICGLPVFRDNLGGIGTPTSDNERTKLEETTRRVLMTVNLYDGHDEEAISQEIERLLTTYANSSEIRMTIVK